MIMIGEKNRIPVFIMRITMKRYHYAIHSNSRSHTRCISSLEKIEKSFLLGGRFYNSRLDWMTSHHCLSVEPLGFHVVPLSGPMVLWNLAELGTVGGKGIR